MIRFIVSLAAEARPLLDRYRLERVPGPFSAYAGDDVRLVVSGVGAAASASAVGWLAGRFPESSERSVWLNVGVAGHRRLEPGAWRLAHTIRDDATGRVWYPPRIGGRTGSGPGPVPAEATALRTVAAPELAFTTDDLYDMEAAGFYPAAIRFATAELVQCGKIVSDNLETKAGELTARRLSELVSAALPAIDALADHLRHLAGNLPSPATPELVRLDRLRFTVSETHRLERLVTRLAALGGREEIEASASALAASGSASEALSWLEKRVETLSLR